MGESQNTQVSGQGKMTALCHAKQLEERYKGAKYNELTAGDQLAIDQAYDRLVHVLRQKQVQSDDAG